jgi:phosphatidate cytidylyltransferase
VTRLLSGAILLAVVVGAAWWAPAPWLLVLAVIVAVLAAWEFAGVARALDAPVPVAVVLCATAVVCVAMGWPAAPLAPAILALVVVAGVLAVARGAPTADSLSRVAATVFAPLYVGLPLGALIAVRWEHGREAALLVLLLVVVSDTAQYYTGRMLGRRPLAPVLSPKKTVEGAAGGVVAGALTIAIVGAWWWPEAPVGVRVAGGVLLVLVGIAGDLFESLMKRAAGVKDSSSLIPGHGGMLDRIDALLFAAPVYYILVQYLGGRA